jgi:surface protein
MGLGRRFFQSTIKQANPFISTWKTDNTSSGSSNADQVKLPLINIGIYNFIVDWGDSSSDTITTWDQAETTHTYSSTGTYTITISGTCVGFRFANSGDRLKILDIQQWGIIQFQNNLNQNLGAFHGCANLDVSATDSPIFNFENYAGFFFQCTSLIGNSSFNNWDVSNIKSFRFFFCNCTNFNQNLGNWNVSNATEMNGMFSQSGFNNGASDSIKNWNVSNVTDFGSPGRGMFQQTPFNQPIGDWDVSSGVTFEEMFRLNTAFNQNLSNWRFRTSGNINLFSLFRNASAFNNQNDPDISDWNTERVTDMSFLFSVSAFNQNIGAWNVGNVTNMNGMFLNNSVFNNGGSDSIKNWDVSKVTTFGGGGNSGMFGGTPFNQPIGDWDVSSGVTMTAMFINANSFAQDLGDWNLRSNVTMSNMLNVTNATIGTALVEWYSRTLIGWANDAFDRGGVPSGRTLGANFRRYNSVAYTSGKTFNDAVSARDYLVATLGWTITGDVQI